MGLAHADHHSERDHLGGAILEVFRHWGDEGQRELHDGAGRERHRHAPGGVTSAALVIVAGLPGTGKTTLADAIARRFGFPVLSVDPVEAAIWRAGIPASFETGVAAYEVVAAVAAHQLALGVGCIVDAVSAVEEARETWRRLAAATEAPLRVVEVMCSDVDLHRRRLESRRRNIPGFYEPTWESVVARRADYRPWPDPRVVVDTARPLTLAIDAAFRHVGEGLADAGRRAQGT